MLDVMVEGIAVADAFERQAGGIRDEFGQAGMRDPNRSFISEARNEPSASAASSGSVIMFEA